MNETIRETGEDRGGRRRVVVVGGGFGGAHAARALEKRLASLGGGPWEIFLIDRNNFFVFYPLLVEAGTGSLEPRHAVVPIRSFLRNTEFRVGEVTGVDLEARTVCYRPFGVDPPEEIGYDHLVLAPGSETLLPDVPGLKEHGFQMKSLDDAVVLRDRVVHLLERAATERDAARRRELLRLVVVGGSFTGVEVAGEFDMFLREAVKSYPGIERGDCEVVLVEMADRILPALAKGLSRYAEREMRKRGMDLRLGITVDAIESRAVRLSDSSVLPTRTVIWTAGVTPSPLIGKLPVPTAKGGWMECEADLRVRGRERVWGIGDCAFNPDPEGRPYPTTAQHAVRQGAQVAQNIERFERGEEPEPFLYETRGTLAALGCRTGVARVFGVNLSGFPAWFLWRTLYLLKMPGWARRFRVALDWTMDLLFRRDFISVGVRGGDRSRR